MIDIQNSRTGALIRQARTEKGLTQKQLAERLHISDRTVSKWERGAGFPDLSLLEPLAEALGLTVTELLHGQREERREEFQTITARDAAAVLRKAWQEKLRGLRKRALIACAALAAVAAVVFFLTLPSAPGGYARRDFVTIEQIFPGGPESRFTFPLDCRGTTVSPGSERFETKLSPTELTARILSQPGVDGSAAVWSLDGTEYRLFTVYPEDGLGRYALLCCYPGEGRRWLYDFAGDMMTAAYLREYGENSAVLFPAFLLAQEGWPVYLDAGEAAPTRFPAGRLRWAFDALRDFYEGPGGAAWYSAAVDEAALTITLTAGDALLAAEELDRVCSAFQVTALVRDGAVYFQINTAS